MVGCALGRRISRIALLLCALAAAGCQNCNLRIDPTGQHFFSHDPPKDVTFQPNPGAPAPSNECAVQITPGRVVAPVGAEVVLSAGVCGRDGFLTANEKVEWMLSPEGVGHFVDLNDRSNVDSLLGAPKPEKITTNYAVGSTSSKFVRLTRGTSAPTDDVYVMRGQAWITLSSPVEGTSHVTAFAPEVYGWQTRKHTASVHWVDAEWAFPPPAVNPAGSRHTFVTSVVRYSTREPVEGWRVRYEITGGPPAGFAPDCAQVVEVLTDSLGQGRVELFQTAPASGTNQITVQLIRPAEASRDRERLIVATGSTTKTWTAPSLSIRKSGPTQVNLSTPFTYQTEVFNGGTVTAKEVVVTDTLPEGLTLVGTNPPATAAGSQLEWRLGDLAAGERRNIEITVRADKPGTFNPCAVVRAGDGLTAQDCVTTTVMSGALDVTLAGPPEALVGDTLRWIVTVTNRGSSAATGVRVVDHFDAGLQHSVSASPIERDLADIPPGQSQQFDIDFTAIAAGKQCHNVVVTAQGGLRAESQSCCDVAPRAGVPPPVAAPTSDPPVLRVTKNGPTAANVGDTVNYTIEITNTGKGTAHNVKVVDHYDLSLKPVQASDGYQWAGNDLVWVIDEMPPGSTVRLGIQCRCESAASNACNRATVTSAELVRADNESCLEIRGAVTPLKLTITNLRNPITVGNQATFEVRVANAGQQADRNVALSVTFPPEITPQAAGTGGPSPYRVDGQTVTFDPVAAMMAGETLTYRVETRGARPGRVRTTAQVRSENTPSGITADVETTVQ